MKTIHIPKADLFHPPPWPLWLPAEWERQEAVWFAWPENPRTWQAVREGVEKVYLALLRAAVRFERVYLLVRSEETERQVGGLLGEVPGNLAFVRYATDDCWCRDFGGLTVRTRGGPERVMLDFSFNAWGGKYPAWERDDRAPAAMADAHRLPRLEIDLVLEGGSLDVNGQGLLLTTEQCLLNPNRNPGLTRSRIEKLMLLYFGVEETLWLHEGVAGDDTDGHIDELARFADARTVLAAVEHSRADANYQALRKNIRGLERRASALGLEVVEMPMPAPVVVNGRRTPASYLNFLFLNGAVLVPEFGVPQDETAHALFRRRFPDREIVPIPCRELFYGRGGIHCVSMQVAA